MRIVVSYDISDDAIRRQIGKVCEAFGQRVQRSVFECTLHHEQMREMIRRLDAARKGEGACPADSIRLYALCAGCAALITVLGHRPAVAAEAGHTVI